MTTLTRSAMDRFRGGFRGILIAPGDERYDAARAVWNGAIDRHPALIARVAGTADVAAAVRFARELGLPVSIRGGGHSTAGFGVADGALMLDMSGMQAVRVDSDARTAVAGPACYGANWTPPPRSSGWPPRAAPPARSFPATCAGSGWRA